LATDDSPCSSAQRIFISGRIGQQPEAGRTAIVVLVDDTPAAVFAVADRLRPGARVTVAALSSLTGRSPVLLTGDNPRARRPAGRLTPIAGVAALGMAFARVYIAAHYPTDVAVGLALGQRWRWSSTSSLTGCSPPPLPPSWRATALYGRYSRPRRRGKKRRSTLDDRAGGPATRRPGAVLYAQVAAVVVVEDALFVGFVVPGETVAVLGGVAASLGPASLPGDDGDRGGSGDRR
jgi:hypothetical protein